MPNPMLSILIIDDEKPIRDEIKSIDWTSVNASVIAEAANGLEGAEKCEQFHPDVILADIEMPLMNGLEFAEQVKHSHPHAQIIFLTSHQKFTYAQKGIELGVLGYVVKSLCMEQDLFPYIEKAADILHVENEFDTFYFSSPMPQNLAGSHQNSFQKSCLEPLAKQIAHCEHSADSLQALKEFCVHNGVPSAELKHLLISHLYKVIPERLSENANYSGALFAAETFEQTLVQYYDFLDSANRLKGMRTEVADAVRYIESNYMKSLTLSDVAEVVSISPNYLSKLFKSELNESFNNYLNTVRVHKAIELLENTNKKVYEVAVCGY